MRCSECSREVQPVVAIDIDGTLADYHWHFTEFAEKYLGRKLSFDYDGATEFSEYLGIDKATYREIKLAYRQGGLKRWMPPFKGASTFVRLVKEMGNEVWLTTTRPYLRLDN